ncbi:hypothetical protein ACFVYD_24995 [Streptomyces sp. NPDC058301]|uniref:hypothetical protein n=1 Tax=Streptomyces sp. NPDC058301 TaxID=3346436 RepID=UPI0036EC2FC6
MPARLLSIPAVAAALDEPHTLRGDGSSIKNHVMPYWADWEMRAITRMDVQSWIRSLIEKGAGPAASSGPTT